MVKCRLIQGQKFFEVVLDGCELKTSYGRIGTKTGTQSDFAKHATKEEALEAYELLIASKEKKGFTKEEEETKSSKRPAATKTIPVAKKAKVVAVLKDLVFVISDNLSKSKAAIEKLIDDNGGSLGSVLSKNITNYYLLSDDDYKDSANAIKIDKAKKFKIPVLHEDFLFDSIKNGKLQDEDDYDLSEMHAEPKKKPTKEESDDDDPPDNSRGTKPKKKAKSESEEEEPKRPAKKPAKKKEESDEEEEVKRPVKKSVKKAESEDDDPPDNSRGTKPVKAKKKATSEEEEEADTKKKKPAKKAATSDDDDPPDNSRGAKPLAKKKIKSEDEEDEKPVKKAPMKARKDSDDDDDPPDNSRGTKPIKKPAKKDESDEEEEPARTAAKKPKKAESEDEEEKPRPAKKLAKKPESDEEEEKPRAKKPVKKAESDEEKPSGRGSTKKGSDEEDEKPAKKSLGGIFADLTFAICGTLSFSKGDFTDLITKHGGEVELLLSKSIDYLIASDDEYEKNAPWIVQAKKDKIPIVHEDFIHDSIKSKKIQAKTDYDMVAMHAA